MLERPKRGAEGVEPVGVKNPTPLLTIQEVRAVKNYFLPLLPKLNLQLPEDLVDFPGLLERNNVEKIEKEMNECYVKYIKNSL